MILAAKTAYRAAFRAYAVADFAEAFEARKVLLRRRGEVLDAILATLTAEATAQFTFDL